MILVQISFGIFKAAMVKEGREVEGGREGRRDRARLNCEQRRELEVSSRA